MSDRTEADTGVEYLDLDDLIRLAEDLFGGAAPIEDVGLLGAAVARPSVMLLGREVYPDLFTKAAALLDSLVGSRALQSGNERLGWLATAVFLDINAVGLSSISSDDVRDLIDSVVTASIDLTVVAGRLKALAAR